MTDLRHIRFVWCTIMSDDSDDVIEYCLADYDEFQYYLIINDTI